MVIIELTQQVNTDAELKALTGISNQHMVYNKGDTFPYMFRNNVKKGDFKADDDSGWWIRDHVDCLDLEGYKEYRYINIDARSRELIAQGYVYDGKLMTNSVIALWSFPSSLISSNKSSIESYSSGH